MSDDLISRAAALKGLEDLNIASFYEENEHSKEAYTEVKAMLKALPPAQPGCEDTVYRKAVQMLLAYFVPEERYAEAVDGLRRLPSAQPVEDARAMCGECDAWNQYKNYPQPGWIPCSKKLPEEKDAGILKKRGTSKRSEYVLATVEVKGERMTVTACTYDGKWDWNMKYAFPDYKIVAWMPLPIPAKIEV